jgi:hypothetical protein
MLASRIFVGLVFVFSGFVKAIDPSGTAIKLEEYLLAFHMPFLTFMAFPFAIALSTAELMIGLNLLLKIRMNLTSWLLLIFMTYFTVLTFILALSNPVTDCGCFGDAVKLTNWQTFWKNVILDVPALLIFRNRKVYGTCFPGKNEWLLLCFNLILPVILSVYCLLHQPVLDFRPYSVGTDIREKMTLPEGAPVDQYETMLVYEKNGIRKEFTAENYPWQDSTWKWVETKQKLIFKGEEPPIHDFSITTVEGDEITDGILVDTGYTFLIIAPKLEHASVKGMQKMNDLAMKVQNSGMRALCLTSSSTSEYEHFRNVFQPAFEICTTDETTLKTMIRANPGLMIINEGVITGKWNFRDAPSPSDIKNKVISYTINRSNNQLEILAVIVTALAVALFYCLIYIIYLKNKSGN